MIFKEDDTIDTILRSTEIRMEKLEDKIAQLGTQLSIAQAKDQKRILKAYGEALSQLETLSTRQIARYQAEEILEGLGLGAIPLEVPVNHLSGGQKTRLGLARILLTNPDMLILDEPTNHLDIRALEWLEEWIQHYEHAIIIVSHDRTFLDRRSMLFLISIRWDIQFKRILVITAITSTPNKLKLIVTGKHIMHNRIASQNCKVSRGVYQDMLTVSSKERLILRHVKSPKGSHAERQFSENASNGNLLKSTLKNQNRPGR